MLERRGSRDTWRQVKNKWTLTTKNLGAKRLQGTSWKANTPRPPRPQKILGVFFRVKSWNFMFLLEYLFCVNALRVLRLHKLWCAADSSNLTSERPESFWWEYDGLLSRNCVRNESLRFLKAQLLHPFCEMQRQVGVILSHFRKCLYREVFFFWSEAKKAAFLTFFLKTLQFLF